MTEEIAMNLARSNFLICFYLSPGLESLHNKCLVRFATEAYEIGFKAGMKEAATKTEEA